MKKIVNVLYILFIILLYHLTKDSNMLLLSISFCLFAIFINIFSTTSIKNVIEDFHNKKYYYSRDKIFKYSLLFTSIISIILGLISYLIGIAMNIKHLGIVNTTMCALILTNISIKIISEYLSVLGYKKVGNNLINIYNISNIILYILGVILLYKVFKLDNYLNIIILYSLGIVNFIIIIIILYYFIFRKIKKYPKKREDGKINYHTKIKNVLVTNKMQTIFNVIKPSYVYFSIIILYYTLLNKYNYNYDDISSYITNIYFYGIIIINFIYKIIMKIYNGEFEKLKDKIISREDTVRDNFNAFINKIINVSLSITILLMVISGPIVTLLFKSSYNFLFDLIPLLFSYVLYNIIININIVCNKNKNILLTLLLGLFFKLIFEVPFISSIYRMGYTLSLGSILSNILGLTISIIIGTIFLKNKLKLVLLDNFNNILNIIYENIILCLIIVLFTLIIKVNTTTFISSLLVIIFYIFITILFYIVKGMISNKKIYSINTKLKK